MKTKEMIITVDKPNIIELITELRRIYELMHGAQTHSEAGSEDDGFDEDDEDDDPMSCFVEHANTLAGLWNLSAEGYKVLSRKEATQVQSAWYEMREELCEWDFIGLGRR